MQRIAQIFLKAYLRQNPVRFRLAQFNFLSKYSWLKNLLEDLRPELFPETLEDVSEDTLVGFVPESVPHHLFHPLLEREIKGDRGIYKIEAFHRKRGNGLIFSGRQLESQQAVTIKVYRLEQSLFSEHDSEQEALRRQRAFKRWAGLQLADERVQDFRVCSPIEAIADPQLFPDADIDVDTDVDTDVDKAAAYYHCYLITPAHDVSPSLAEVLAESGKMPAKTVQSILAQILQTLAFLHQQRYLFPSGEAQTGLIHGNLSLDHLLWVTYYDQTFVYLTDLLQWERCFSRSQMQTLPNADHKAWSKWVKDDLEKAGLIALSLLNGQEITSVSILKDDLFGPQSSTTSINLKLKQFIFRLLGKGPSFDHAENAWEELLLIRRSPAQLVAPSSSSVDALQHKRRSPWLAPLLLLTLLTMLGSLLWIVLGRSETTAHEPVAPIACCFSDIKAIPEGTYTYTAVTGGTWSYVVSQTNLLARNQTLAQALTRSQPGLHLDYQTSASVAEAIESVQRGQTDFAVLPVWQELPNDLESQVIGYDGLVVVVSFSYSERQQGLPLGLNGEMSLDTLRLLLGGQITRWQQLGQFNLEEYVQLYIALNTDDQLFLEQEVLQGINLEILWRTTTPSRAQFAANRPIKQFENGLDMLRQIIRDFENTASTGYRKGSVGVTSISKINGQCSVYPLAISTNDSPAVQPLILADGQAITPKTNLCERKGTYQPDSEAFQQKYYPLAYDVAVVYPRDNNRSTIGQKFAELMHTEQGQALLTEAGLVPVLLTSSD